MTPADIKRRYLENNPDGQFFTRDNMRFAGDTMANFGCCDAGFAWELFRKRAVKNGLSTSHYFDKIDFRRVYKPEQPDEPHTPRLIAALIQSIEEAGFSVSGPTDWRAAEHGEPRWVCAARETIVQASQPTI